MNREYAIYTEDQLLRMISFYKMEPGNEQAKVAARGAEDELASRNKKDEGKEVSGNFPMND